MKYVELHLLAGLTVRFFFFGGVNIGVFRKSGSRPIKWHQCRLLTRQLFFSLHIYSLWSVLGRLIPPTNTNKVQDMVKVRRLDVKGVL